MKRVHSWFAAGPLFSIAWLVVGTAGALPPPESEPTLPAKDLAPQSIALSGSGYAVDSPTQVKNFLGQFSIRSDWGEIDAAGGVLLAHCRDAGVGGTGTINGVVRVAIDPVGTITGIPAGVGRLFNPYRGRGERRCQRER